MAQAHPNFTGTWQLNIEKSTMRGPVPGQTLMKIEHTEPKLMQRVLVIHDDGRENCLVFNYETGNETTNHAGIGTTRSRADWDGPELVIESWLQSTDRELHFKDHWTLSSDGQTLTMAHRDDDLAGQVSVLHTAPPQDAAKFKTRE